MYIIKRNEYYNCIKLFKIVNQNVLYFYYFLLSILDTTYLRASNGLFLYKSFNSIAKVETVVKHPAKPIYRERRRSIYIYCGYRYIIYLYSLSYIILIYYILLLLSLRKVLTVDTWLAP
jgi:hypothetical protein